MNRRDFLGAAAALALSGLAPPSARALPLDDLKGFKIVKVIGFTHVGRRPKLVGKNSHLDVHGDTTRDRVLRIMTDQGVEGFGSGSATPELARQLIGQSLDAFWVEGVGVRSPLGRSDHALYDLIGKALGVPSWELFGGRGPEWVEIYDGSIYFNDLLPEYAARGVARVLEEVEAGLKRGHRAFKVKVGRGFKWMEKQAGFRRDVEVVQAIRKLVGADVKLMVDANNGFTLDETTRWLDAVGDDLFFIEEMFPERIEEDLKLKEFLKSKGWKTLVADGESADRVEHFDAFLDAGALDVLQPDIRAFGLTLQWEQARKAAAHPSVRLAPHNWGSYLGLYMQLTLGRGIGNFLIAEQDTSDSDLFDASAYQAQPGQMRPPDVPGCGLVLKEDVFEAKYKGQAWVVS